MTASSEPDRPVLHFSDETIDRLANFVKVMEAADRREKEKEPDE